MPIPGWGIHADKKIPDSREVARMGRGEQLTPFDYRHLRSSLGPQCA